MPPRKLLKSKVQKVARIAGRASRLGVATLAFRRHTKTDMFNPLTAIAQSAYKSYQKKRYAGKSMKRKSVGTTRSSSKKRKLAVRSMPKNRIGSSAGLIVSNQKVPRPKKGSVQYRRSVYGTSSAQDKLWLGGSSIGEQSTHFKVIAHTILAHYLPKMGDFRATNTQQSIFGASSVFKEFQVKYASDMPPGSVSLSQFRDGAVILDAGYEYMAATLGAEIAAQAIQAYYPTSIRFVNPDSSGNKLSDVNLGRHTITVSCKGRFRFQNVTLPSDDTNNINAVDANPISGKIYTFRNQAPLFSPGYVQAAGTVQQNGIKALQTVLTPFEMYGKGHKGDGAFDAITAPPLNPSSIWRNVSSTGNAVFPPGGFQTHTTSYLRSETIAKYCQNITQAAVVEATVNAQYPPAGDAFMMCLRPTIKTSGETLKLAYDTEYIYTASIKRRKASPLQVVNLIE